MKTVIKDLLAEYDMSDSAFAKDLREALAEQPAQQEPVARIDSEPSWDGALGLYRAEVTLTKKLGQFTDLYTTPQAPKENT